MKKNKLLNQSGQIAVILIFFIAVLLAAFAVIINIGKISQARTAATIAVDASAALMASEMASYAESTYQQVITGGSGPVDDDGQSLTRAESGGILWYIVDVVIALVGLVLAIFTEGTSLYAACIVIAALSVALTAGMLIMQVAVVAPEMNAMWTRMFKNLTVAEQFREQGIQTLFSFSAQDPALVDDTGDFDMDGVWYDPIGTDEQKEEKVGRFSVLYTRRAEYLMGKQWGNPPPVPSASDGIVIYGWRDEDKPGQPAGSGKWHIIRVQANLPTLCGDQCARVACEDGGEDPAARCLEPYMPWIHEWNHTINSQIWYSLIDYAQSSDEDDIHTDYGCKGLCGIGNGGGSNQWDCGGGYDNKESYKEVTKCFKGGLVRADLIRWDESGGALNWATGVNFWNMMFQNPKVPITPYVPGSIEFACDLDHDNHQTPDGGNSYALGGPDGTTWAFVLNKPSSENAACWTLANQMLLQGIEASSCAEYFARHSDSTNYKNSKLGVKFVKCPDRPWPGVGFIPTSPDPACAGIVCSNYYYDSNDEPSSTCPTTNGCCWKYYYRQFDSGDSSCDNVADECIAPNSETCTHLWDPTTDPTCVKDGPGCT